MLAGAMLQQLMKGMCLIALLLLVFRNCLWHKHCIASTGVSHASSPANVSIHPRDAVILQSRCLSSLDCALIPCSFCQVTAILYANPDWEPSHGGQLRLWLPPNTSGAGGDETALSASNSHSAVPCHHVAHASENCHDECTTGQMPGAGCDDADRANNGNASACADVSYRSIGAFD